MALSSKSELVGLRFGPYIEELRAFLTARSLHTGRPQDIFALAQRISESEFFREEMSSMIRAVVYREREAISRLELLEIVTFAVAGQAIDENSRDFYEPVRQILDFLAGILRSLWRPFPDEVAEIEAGATTADKALEPAEIREPETAAATTASSGFAAESQGHSQEALNVQQRMTREDSLTVFSRAVTLSGYEEKLNQSGAPRRSRRLHAAAWIALACVLIFAAVFSTFRSHVLSSGFAGLYARYSGHSAASGAAQVSLQHETVPTGALPVAAVPKALNDHADAHLSSTPAPNVVTQGTVPTTAAPEHQPARIPAKSNAPPVVSSSPVPPSGAGPRHSANVESVHQPNIEGVFFISSGLMTGHLIAAPEPHYPRMAKLMHVEGPVILQVVVSPEGTVSAMHVLRGHWLLRGAAEDAVRAWRYRPYVIDGRATDIATIITLEFRLHR